MLAEDDSEVAVASAFVKVASVVVNKHGLRLITSNIGSLALHRDAFLNLVNLHQPHICFLQEAQLRNGIDHSLRVILAPMGYSLLVGKNNLCSVVRHGMNVGLRFHRRTGTIGRSVLHFKWVLSVY